jgi:hypothetical protein
MSQEIHRLMLKALLDLREAGPSMSRLGICANVQEFLDYSTWDNPHIDRHDVLWKAFYEWTHYSGNQNYPVPSTNKKYSAELAYDTTEDLWSRRTKYGKLRWELLDHCIEYFQQQVNQANQIQGDSHASS